MSQHHLLPLFFFLALFFLSGEVIEGKNTIKLNCDKADDQNADRAVGKLMTIGEADLRFPENDQDMVEFCRNETALISQMEAYKSQCLVSRTRQIVAVVVYSMKNMVRMYCRRPNSKRTQELLSSTPCANAAHNGYYQCQRRYRDELVTVDELMVTDTDQGKLYLAQICCGYLHLLRCLHQMGAEQGEHICSEQHIELNIFFVKAVFENAVNLLCSEYTEVSDRCEKHQMISVPENASKINGTFFSPLLRLLTKI